MNKTDIDLLESAAKAARYVELKDFTPGSFVVRLEDGYPHIWNPLEDDGQALRLAVKLQIAIDYKLLYGALYVQTWGECSLLIKNEPANHDACAAARRAIVRTAARIGESL